MANRLRSRLTYANVVSSICLFVLLGGGAYAATRLNGRDIVNRSISGQKIKPDALTGREIRESRLSRVPHAGNSDRLEGNPASAFLRNGQAAGGALQGSYPQPQLSCPAEMTYQSGFCFETTAHDNATWYEAADRCAAAGWRLPSASEQWAITNRPDVSTGGWTDTIYRDEGAQFPNINKATHIFPGPPTQAISEYANSLLDYQCVVNAGAR